MFENLSKKLAESFDKLRRKGVLSAEDVDAAMREVRIALLEADVALPVVKDFIAGLKEKAVGAQVIATVNPAQMVIKLVHDELVYLLGGEASPLPGPATEQSAGGLAEQLQKSLAPANELNLAATPPAVVLMCGLQGSGKTTSTAKLAKRLKDKQRKRVLVASLDVYRPAAQEQLATVAVQAGVDSLPIVPGEQPRAITERAMDAARKGGYDVLLLDTAGRLHVDDALMQELIDVKAMARPIETLLVADALTGQDAVNIAKSFHDAVGVTGIILTRMDGDARGGAALSMRHVTGQPIKFVGLGEKIDALEPFHPARVAGRILDKGDVVALVERAAEVLNEKDAEESAKRMMAGAFDMNDMLKHMQQIKKMGGVGSMLSLMPGMGKIKEAMAGKEIDESVFARQEAIILSMTKKERAQPNLLNASRRRRIATGSGTTVQQVNQLVKQYQQMETMMKQMKKMGGKGMMNPMALKRMFGNLG
ncbi:MAG: signal recognition particle protein [Azospirillum brasilense]|nr:MAG: signal recognition particle protein [Azospirillum brasilense]